ncbi:MAG: hypothetical protein JWN98_2259, partial [Abditibacteriota bacterium]|nr:hypothetical protein [Abditibacteriota bacterium]
ALLATVTLNAAGYLRGATARDAAAYVPIATVNASPKASPHKPAPKGVTQAKTPARTQAGAAKGVATAKVDYIKDIHPLLQEACGSCHLNGKKQGGFQLDTRASILQGGGSGPAVVVGNSAKSLMIDLVTSHDPERMMPLGGDPLTPKHVALLRTWIDQGLSFGTQSTLAKAAPSKAVYRPLLKPRRPKLAPARAGASANPIDRLLEAYFKSSAGAPKALVNDRIYARRVYLDIVGLLPSSSELAAFIADKSLNKREALVTRLLGDNENYAQHWLSFWNDALRNDYAGTGYIDGGRKQITNWLYNALLTNKPYDRFVAELIDPMPESEGFTKGIIWRGTVNASQTPPMQAAQNISQVFLGINMKCASCHDSFINDWKLSDAYGLAGVYAEAPLEMVRCDKPTGKIAPIKFVYPELGSIDGAAPKAARLKQLANIMTGPDNGRLSRTLVNRVWARLMGRGFIEPVDEMDNPPWSADLLDWLAADFADNGYDLHRLIRLITTSHAYQRPPVGASAETTAKFQFSGPLVRRLSAEQFTDAVSSLTGVWPQNAAVRVGASTITIPSKWIWNDAKATTAVPGGRIYLRKTVEVAAKPLQAPAVISCDNACTLYVNGKKVAENEDWQKPTVVDLAPHLEVGANVLAVQAANWPDIEGGKGLSVTGPGAAGFVFYSRLQNGASQKGATPTSAPVQEIASDSSWLVSNVKSEGWQTPTFAPDNWKAATELGDADLAPWKLRASLTDAMQVAASRRGVRAALLKADTLTTALGRPNREQVVTSRPTAATTLQSLELTNGSTLASQLKQGAARWMAEPQTSERELITRIFERSLGRKPTNTEMQTAQSIVGNPVHTEGIEDLLWVITMLPEFQLIY